MPVLPELVSGTELAGLPRGELGEQSPATHLVDVGAGAVLSRHAPGRAGFAGLVKLAARVIAPIAAPHSIRVCVGVALLGASAISFYWADMRMGVNQQWNYFDTLSRLWEPLAGGLLAVWLPDGVSRARCAPSPARSRSD